MKFGLKKLLLAFGLSAVCAASFAVFDPVNDDSDLFRNNPNIPSERPNVLIILDNTANWNSAFTNEKAAFVSVVNALDSSFNVGWMMYPETGNPNDSIDGAYVRFAMRQMDSTNKAALSSIITAFNSNSDKGNNSTLSLAMHEAWLYFGGRASRASYGKIKTDFAGNTTGNPTAAALGSNALPANPTSTSLYNAAIGAACQKNYIIYISNGPANENVNSLGTAETLLTAAKGSAPSVIAISPNGMASSWADEYAQFMSGTDINGNLTGTQTAITYTVEIDPGSQNQDLAMTALMKSVANQGKGKYFAVTSANSGQAIVDALTSIFTEIQAVNSVFAASTLPVSVNVRGTNLNQLYIGVFRPDATDQPRWLGNLKAYQLKKDATTGAVFTVDKNGTAAINSSTGFITSTAVSFWTSGSLPNGSYWSFRSSTVNGVGGNSDSPDGDLVEKGGAAQQVRGLYFANGVNGVSPNPSRPLYTCTQGSPVCLTTYSGTSSLLSATPFVDANADIDAGSLNINTKQVTPLTAAVIKPITVLADTRALSLNNATGFVQTVSSITTNTTTLTASSISNTRQVNISSMTNGATPHNVSQVIVANGNNKVATATTTSTIAGGVSFLMTGTTNFNGSRTTINSTSTTFTFGSFNGPISETAGGYIAYTSNTTVNVVAPSHGFTNGQQVTIANAAQASFNGLKTITVVSGDTNNFSYANTVDLAPTTATTFTATGVTTTVTVNFAAAHGLLAGQSVVIAGANPTTYNGTYTIATVPSTTSFTYTTASAISTANSGTVTVSTSGTTATATVTAHGFTNGSTVNISGALPAGFDGAVTVANATANTFDFTVPAGLGSATANPTIQVTTTLSPTVTATLANHGFTALTDYVTIAGTTGAGHAGSFQVLTTPDTSTFTYLTGVTTAPGGSPTVRLTTNPLAYATIASHGYGAAGTTINPFIVAGTTPVGYNGTFTTAKVVDTNTVSYPLSAAQGASSGTITATTYSTTATGTSTAHGLIAGAVVTISGASPSAFNGSVTIVTVPSADTFTYTLSSPQGAATGSINLLSSGSGASERTQIINWVRGEDNREDENANSSFSDTRASIHGDVLHSRPAVVNYNRRTTDTANIDNDVYIFYGGNDGVFRAVKGGFGSSTGDPAPGAEVWGFVAREHFGNLRRLRLNSPTISSNFKKPYFFDGSIGTYTLDTNGDGKLVAADGDKVWMYLTMRRGGRFIYALDVSDPLVPKLLWRKGCPSLDTVAANIDATTGCDLGWGELGQTWSEPKVISINCTASPCGATDPVLMFGAGYDSTIEDLDPSTITNSTSSTVQANGTTYTRSMGRGIYVVNGRTGNIIWQAAGHARADSSTHAYKNVSGMNFSIPSDMAVVVGDPTPKPFRAYVGDTGANIWRIDFGDTDPANWTVAKLAAVGDQTTAAGRRKFQFAPDVIGGSGFDMVITGSGDREHPFDTTVTNRVYAFKDRRQTNPAVVSGTQVQATIAHSDTFSYNSSTIKALLDVSTNCIQVAANCSGTAPELAVSGTSASMNTSGALSSSSNEGWFITLASGEKQVGSTLAAGSGAIVFGTNQPSASAGGGACSPNLGVARQYSVNFADGTAFSGTSLFTTYAGGGFLPSPVLVYVGLGGSSGTGSGISGGVPVGGTVSGGQLKIGAGAGLGGGNDPTGVVCYGASCSLAPGKQLYSRLRKFWFKEID